MKVQKSKFNSVKSIYLIVFLILLLPLHLFAADQWHTIQTGSFGVYENAEKQFDSLKQKLNGNQVDYLRIVKIDEYFKVRLGKFENNSDAERLLSTIKPNFPETIVMNISQQNENIVKIAQKNTSVDEEKRNDEAIEAYRKAIEGAKDDKERATLYKELGDIFVVKEDFKSAAKEYIQALSLSREFSENERLKMAVYISWGDRLNEAITELRLIVKENPQNHEAQKNLAKVLMGAGRNDEAIEAYRKAIEGAKDDKERATLYKELGDIFVVKEDFKSATDEFKQALSLSHHFTEKERMQIAIYYSWINRLDDAIAELESILKENPSNLDARINLARVLSWSGRLDEAIDEADKVLEVSPENKDALLVKSNSLQWKGKYKKAIPLYERVLEKEEGFDARLGLAYSYLNTGDITAARRSCKFLEPAYSYQERELEKFKDHIDKIIRPNFDMRYSYYNDSDDNIVNRYLVGFSFWLGNWKNDIQYQHIDAKDNIRDGRVENVSLMTYSKIAKSLGVGGRIGASFLYNDRNDSYFTGHLKADLDVLNGTIGVSVEKDVFAETAELIENRIRVTNTNLYISQAITDSLSLFCSYRYGDYSDDNNANDFQISPRYTIFTKNPTINLRYKFRYLNFNRQSRSGYFDPNDFLSHQILVSAYLEKDKLYAYVEPYIGYQSFTRYGDSSDEIIGGAYGYLGVKITKSISLELNAEGGNYAVETAAGWNYFMVGCRLLVFL